MSRPSRSLIGWHSSATVPTVSQACPGSARSPPRRCSARYGHLENIPADATDWDVTVRGAATLAATLASQRANAETFKRLATVRTDAVVGHSRRLGVDRPDRGLPGLVRAIWPAASGRPGRRLGRRAHIVTRDGSRDGKRRGGSEMVLDLAARIWTCLTWRLAMALTDHLHVRVCHPRRQ